MIESAKLGNARSIATIRTPVLTFILIRWDWEAGKRRDKAGLDITHMVQLFQWQKSIKNPTANCTITIIPQYKNDHLLDFLSTMDVLEIREFGRLKFHGYIKNIGASGQIQSTGAPSRTVQLSVQNFGGLFLEGQLGVNMFMKMSTYKNLGVIINKFTGKMSDALTSGGTYAEIVGLIIEEWFLFLEANNASTYRRYIDEWMDLTTGLSGQTIIGVPESLAMFKVSDQEMSLWSVLQKVVEAPFNEMWFDVGPRSVSFEANANLTGRSKLVKFSEDKTYLVLRQTPFNKTVINGTEKDLWNSLPIKILPMNHLTKWDLNKTMDESYSFYMVSPTLFDPGDLALLAQGIPVFDEDAFNKYLYRPLTHNMFYKRKSSNVKSEVDSEAQRNYLDDVKDKAQTLKNWFEKNDQYLSGSLTMHVPKYAGFDPDIGERCQLEGIDGTFYIEAITHTWQYEKPLFSHVTVTRGYGTGKAIELRDKIFKRGKFVMDEQWSR